MFKFISFKTTADQSLTEKFQSINKDSATKNVTAPARMQLQVRFFSFPEIQSDPVSLVSSRKYIGGSSTGRI